MPLVIEDGTGVANANSYGTLVGVRAYATARGIILPADDAVVTAYMILAMDYIGSLDYLGAPISFTQPLDWPRKQLMFDVDTPVPTTYIPPNLIDAQYQLVIEQFDGVNLQPTYNTSGGAGAVTEEKVDVLLTRYSEKIGTTAEPIMPKVDALLKSLRLPTPALRTVRI